MFRPLLTSLALASSLISPCSLGQEKWRLPSAYSATMFQTENLAEFARDAERETAGKLKIELHPGGALFKGPDIKPAVKSGKAEIGEVIMSALAAELPVMGVDSIPFLAGSYADARKLWTASRAETARLLEAQGMKLLFAVPWPPQGLYSRKPIESARDLNGLKLRTYNPATKRIAELLGAAPTEVAVVDLPKAMAEGRVDAFFSSSATGVDTKAWEHLGYFYDVQAWVPKNVVFVNAAAFSRLDPASREGVMRAAAAAEARGWTLSEAKARDYNSQLASKGMKVLPPPPNLTREFDRIGEKLSREWLKQLGPSGLGVVLEFLDKRAATNTAAAK